MIRFLKCLFWLAFVWHCLLGAHYLHWERAKTLKSAIWYLVPMIGSEEKLDQRAMEIRRRLSIPHWYRIDIEIVDSIEHPFGGRAAGSVRRVGPWSFHIKMVSLSYRTLVHEMCHIAHGHLDSTRGRGSSRLAWYFWYTTVWEPEAILCEIDYYKTYGFHKEPRHYRYR